VRCEVTNWCPSARKEVTLLVEAQSKSDVVGDIIRGKAVGCSLKRECPSRSQFCWLRSKRVETRVQP
jgi:hypothetical protein